MEREVLSNSQMDRIYRELVSPSHKRIFSIARYTGAKVSEILRLKVSNVYGEDLQPLTSILFVSPLGKIREVPIVEKLHHSLVRYRPSSGVSIWLFPSSIHKGDHVSHSSVDKAFRTALYRSELDGKDISLKGLRQSFVYTLYHSGMGKSDISEVLGSRNLKSYRWLFQESEIDLKPMLTRIFE